MPNHQKSPKLRPSWHRKVPKLRRGGVTPHEVRRQHQSLAFAYGLRPAPARPRICPPAPGILVDRVEGQRAHAPLAGAQLPDRLPTRPALPGRAKFRRQLEPPSRRSTCQLGDREAGSPGRRTGRSARSAPRRARRSPRRVIGDPSLGWSACLVTLRCRRRFGLPVVLRCLIPGSAAGPVTGAGHRGPGGCMSWPAPPWRRYRPPGRPR